MHTPLCAALLFLSVTVPAVCSDAPAAQAAGASCRLVRIGTLDMDMDGSGRIHVPLKFNSV